MKKQNVFKILAIYMIGFGILVGIIFPFFVDVATSVDKNELYNIKFFTMTITAGILVGLVNIILAKQIVGQKVSKLSKHMGKVETLLEQRSVSSNFKECVDDSCLIEEISKDEIGKSAESFNSLVKALSKSLKTENSVREFTEILSAKLDLNNLAIEALTNLLDSLDTVAGAIIIEKDAKLQLLTSYGISKPNALIKNNMIIDVFNTQKTTTINIPENVKIEGVLLEIQPKCVVLEPIIYKGSIIGTIVLASLNHFDEDKKSLLKQYGQGLALAFKNATVHNQLQEIAANDPLTKVLNRRFGIERLKDEYARSIRTDQPLGLIMIDIDHFKKVNDTYGHLVGDQVLIALKDVAKRSLREGDIFFRYGGEEFVAILPGASLKDVKKIAEGFRRYVEELEVKYDNQLIKVTVSIGGTSMPEKMFDDYTSLIEASDENLYSAKENGRNQVMVS